MPPNKQLKTSSPLTFQEMIFRLSEFWAEQGCVIALPYDVEVGAGTMCPETFLRVLGPTPWRVAYPQPSRRARRRPLWRQSQQVIEAHTDAGDSETST